MTSSLNTYKKILRFSFFVFGFFVFSTLADAAVISIKTPTSSSVGSRVSVDILVDPQNQSINSIESTINFSKEELNFNGFSIKQSSIPIWVEEPKEKVKGQIHFSGVVPGGLERLYDPVHTDNRAIPVLRLFFIAKTSGTANFSSANSSVLENDGKGTSVLITEGANSINILPVEVGASIKTSLSEDVTPPNPFTVTFVERSVFGKTPRLAIFSAEDNEGGIEHYEVGVGNLGFHNATSPFSLPYRLFPYTLTVRAFDFSGNLREQQVLIPGESPYGLGIALALLAIIFGILRYRYTRRKKL